MSNKFEILYSIGDHITVNGIRYRIIGVHVYLSERCQTERYYLGNEQWYTIKRSF